MALTEKFKILEKMPPQTKETVEIGPKRTEVDGPRNIIAKNFPLSPFHAYSLINPATKRTVEVRPPRLPEAP